MAHPAKRKKSKVDRLSGLPDSLLLHILSFIETRYAVQVSILSTRYRQLWTFVPTLRFDCECFHKLSTFDKLVSHVITRHDHQSNVSSIRYDRRGKGSKPIERVLKYAVSQPVEHLEFSGCLNKIGDFTSRLFSTQSLRTLHLENWKFWDWGYSILEVPKSFCLPFLSTLYLEGVLLQVSDNVNNVCFMSFSECPNLKSLTLVSCKIDHLKLFHIVCPVVENFTFKLEEDEVCRGKVVLTAPKLTHLNLQCPVPIPLCFDNLSSLMVPDYGDVPMKNMINDILKKTLSIIFISSMNSRYPNFVTISWDDIIQLLSHIPSVLPSDFLKLKSLKLKFYHEGVVHKVISYLIIK